MTIDWFQAGKRVTLVNSVSKSSYEAVYLGIQTSMNFVYREFKNINMINNGITNLIPGFEMEDSLDTYMLAKVINTNANYLS